MASGGFSQQTKLSTVKYFYGRITREEAEIILQHSRTLEGTFLLRESINPLGNYAISVCHDGNVHHYAIEKQTDGMYMIPQGKKFIGPVELIKHHTLSKNGIITLLKLPCERSENQAPVAFRGMSYHELENELLRKAKSIKGVKMDRALGPQREHLVILVARDLHQKQPWYHGKITRDDCEKRFRTAGHKDGKFLVRMRDDKKTFALCISYHKETRHYIINQNQENKYGIQDGPKFECVMMLIDHYHNRQDGLLCKLTEPCPSPGYNLAQLDKYMETACDNIEYLKVGDVNKQRPSNLPNLPATPSTPGGSRSSSLERPPPIPTANGRSVLQRNQSKNDKRPLPPPPEEDGHATASPFNSANVILKGLSVDADELEETYGSISKMEHFNLRSDQIQIEEELGSGQFGSVCKGKCQLQDGRVVPVAIKTLKNQTGEDSAINAEMTSELMTEAKLMQPLSHKHIVRMIGLCKAESIMLVLEIAPLGQLNSYLKNHKDVPQSTIVELMWQVAQGMQYLESKMFVHRDLAARNVLLLTEHFAKISDFGMSKALSRDDNYYSANVPGKWPLKWYAPECVYYWKFDSKSDVWSYGVTMWEACSYGEKPYNNMNGSDLMRFLVDEGQRLAKPRYSDDAVYQVMLECWTYDKKERPTFKEVAAKMEALHAQSKLIDHYHNRQDGLLCKLTEPCPSPGYNLAQLGTFNGAKVILKGLSVDADELEETYGSISKMEHFNLRSDQIQIGEELGSGQFGSVCKGKCRLQDGRVVPVAIKTLKNQTGEDSAINAEMTSELLTEAKLMQPLTHKHIVRMIGLCKAESIMLVLEIAPLGQLNSYLKNHKDVPQSTIVELMWQVAQGMQYLESKMFVHRDLAARNVLLLTEHFAKISDFGMSKALSRDDNYYSAHESGKWPLKWYAPECMLYWKFDSKSDVWSYGVTMWEACSYGEKPYKNMKGPDLMRFLVDEGQRLAKPRYTDDAVYQVMLECWTYEKKERPTFKEVAAKMEALHAQFYDNSRS